MDKFCSHTQEEGSDQGLRTLRKEGLSHPTTSSKTTLSKINFRKGRQSILVTMVRAVVHHTSWPHVISRKEVHQNFVRASPIILMQKVDPTNTRCGLQ